MENLRGPQRNTEVVVQNRARQQAGAIFLQPRGGLSLNRRVQRNQDLARRILESRR